MYIRASVLLTEIPIHVNSTKFICHAITTHPQCTLRQHVEVNNLWIST